MGVLLPWINGLSAVIGGATGLGIMAWICARAQAAIQTGELSFATKPVDTHGCDYTFIGDAPFNLLAINQTDSMTHAPDKIIEHPEFAIYHISYIWYTLIGALITMSIAFIISAISGFNDPKKMDPKLFAPFVRKWLRLELKEREDPIGTEDDIRYADCVDLKAIPSKV